jgi:tight adherence protein C
MTGISSNLLQVMLAAALCLVLVAVVLLPGMRRRDRIEARIRAVSVGAVARNAGPALVPTASSAGSIPSRMLRALGQAVVSSGLLSSKSVKDLEQTMAASGHKTNTTLPLFVGAKVALFIGAPLLVWIGMTVTGIQMHPKILPVMGGAVLGLLVPDYMVRRGRKRYLDQLETGLPDALDLLIICSEAGLALEAGFDRVAAELGEANGPTASELRTTGSEMKILNDRRRALLNMGTRTGLEVMARLGGTLAQTIQYGTPISQALRVLAAEMRQSTLTRFEEKAAKLPVMLTIPMILFILPCIFLVVGGPAVVGVMETMMHR